MSNDHVNKSQSSNDIISISYAHSNCIRNKNKLLPSLNILNQELKKGKKFKNIIEDW